MKQVQWSKVVLKNMMWLLLAIVVIIAGCSNNNNASEGTTDTANNNNNNTEQSNTAETADLPHVELIWYYGIGAAQPDQQAVEDAANKYLAENTDINVTLKLRPIDFGTYDEKMNPIIASKETFDLMWLTSNWLNLYQPLINKGALVPLDDLLEEYAPKLRHTIMPEGYWDSMRSATGEKKIHAVFSLQIAASPAGFAFQKRFLDKYDFDVSQVKDTKDIEPLLKQIKENEPDIIPLAFPSTGGNSPFYPDNIGINGFYYYTDDPFTAVQRESTPEFKAHVELMHDWYNKGYIYQDLAAVQDFTSLQMKGNIAVTAEQGVFPGSDVTITARSGGNEVVTIPLTPAQFGSNSATGTMNGISSTSKHPERAMMLMELVNTDQEFYRILCYGVEGVHYNLVDGFYKPIDGAGYAPGIDWVFGNSFNGYVKEGQPIDVFEQTKKMNAEAVVAPSIGFRFDDSELQTEQAATRAVFQEYISGLETGTFDPDVYLPRYLDALQKAGQDKIDTELQKQLDAWVAENGK